MTVIEAYTFITNRLQGNDGVEEARVKARLLVDHAAGKRYAHLMQPDTPLLAEAETWLQKIAERVAAGYPVAYAIGSCEFHGHVFRCDERALIPRPETETLIDAALKLLCDKPQPLVADLGTGTGCIALSVASALSEATVHATDISAEALALAESNARDLKVVDRVRLFQNESPDQWAMSLLATGKLYDAVLSNPPYIATGEAAALQPEIRDWEPHQALFSGRDGLDSYRSIAAQCGALLAADGFLMVELGAGQFGAARAIFETQGWRVAEPLRDLAGIERVLEARR